MATKLIDKVWFKERLAAQKISQRKLAQSMEMDPASISYLLSGKRKMSMDEAKKIAGHLMMPVTEVMRKAGIDVTDDVRKIPIAGSVNCDREVTMFPRTGVDYINAPHDMPNNSFALQYRCHGEDTDGWIYFVSGEEQDPNDCIDQYCYVVIKSGIAMITSLKRGYKSGLFNLSNQWKKSTLENKAVLVAQRIQWIMPT